MSNPLRGLASRVYFIRSGATGPIKIGYAANAYGRFHNLQAGNPEVLHYLGDIDGDRDTEHDWHLRFQDLHIRGEWHEVTDGLLAAIEEALERQQPIDLNRLRALAAGAALA